MASYAYILVCSDGSYYTGHTDNLERRIGQHQSGLVPGHTKSRRPVRLVWSQEFGERYEALSAERQIKGWSRAKKEALIDRRWDELSRLSKSRSQFALRQAQGERVALSREAYRDLLDAPDIANSEEVCGLLLGVDKCISSILPARNIHPTPRTHFEIDPQALIDAHRAERAGGLRLMGYYHSHPTGEPYPSATDREQSPRDGKIWAIIAPPSRVTFWRDTAEGFHPLSYLIEGR